ncbi:MAG: GNAT family N-acetyltransferase [Gemmatimonadota bacterium]|nr:GNAT family N-acetyltransferase [Gemmatimonadota bacterium]
MRPAREEDLSRLRVLFRRSIRALAVGHYDPPQIEAWAGASEDEGWIASEELPDLWVAQIGVSLVGFAEISPEGDEVRMVYVEPTVAERGIGTALLERVEEEARRRGVDCLSLRSSLNAVPFFEKFGYETRAERERRMDDGTILRIVDMQKPLG